MTFAPTVDPLRPPRAAASTAAGRPVRETHPVPPLASVIIPAFNSSATIERCLTALARQETRRRFEVLVVHSGTDDTCERARRALPGARTIQLAQRANPPQARNVGVTYARGSILAFIDTDIYVDPTWIDQVARTAESGYDLVCGSIENANPDSSVSRAEQLLMFNEFLPTHPSHPSWFALSGNTVMPRAAYDRFGPLVEVRAAEDVVFSRRLVAAGGRILFDAGLRVAHDNRTHLGRFLRNQVLVGRHTAIARRLVPFADSSSYALFLALLPVAPAVKLAKIAIHVGRYDPRQLRAVVKDFPTLVLGAWAYSIGLVWGAMSRVEANTATATDRPRAASGQITMSD